MTERQFDTAQLRAMTEFKVQLHDDRYEFEPIAVQGVNVREADYERPETLVTGLAGVKRLLLIVTNSSDRRTAQHRAVIEAAAQAGAQLIGYTSCCIRISRPCG